MPGTHQERERRLTVACPVEVHHGGGVLSATTQDVAHHGLYVRTKEALASGDEAIAAVTLPDRAVVSFPVRVAHVLTELAAQSLGRVAGMGLEIEGAVPHAWEAFVSGLEIEADSIPEVRPMTLVILDKNAALRERLETNLVAGGFEAHAAGDVASALELCRTHAPDILVADARTQGSNPVLVVKFLASEPELADIPVVLLADDASDLLRLQAYRRGIRDVVPKPFTDEELMIRLRRLGTRGGRPSLHVSLRGVLEDVGVPTLLSLLEFEKKPGTLVLAHESQVGRIVVAKGRVLRASLAGYADSPSALRALLEWTSGSFAFLPGAAGNVDEIGMTISQILIDTARESDETQRGA